MPFSLAQRLWIFVIIEAALLSAASVTFILCFALYSRLRTIHTWKRKELRKSPESDATSSILFLNLMFADLIQASAILPDIKWMIDGAVMDGRLCQTQAALKQIGIVGVSMTSLAISFHTFAILVLRWKGPPDLPKYAIVGVWAFTALVIGSANAVHRDRPYYGNTGYWCWILPQYTADRIVTEYLWVWLSGLFMIVLYSIMFVVIRGWFTIGRGIHWYNKSFKGALDAESDDDRKIKAVANSMLYYPALYIICVVPNTLTRWLFFSDDNPPYQVELAAQGLYALSGVFNLILFAFTRPKVLARAIPKDVIIHNHRRDTVSSLPNSPQKREFDYGILSIDIEKTSFEVKSPARTMNHPRSSYDLQGVSTLPFSPLRPSIHRGTSPIPEVEEVLDIA